MHGLPGPAVSNCFKVIEQASKRLLTTALDKLNSFSYLMLPSLSATRELMEREDLLVHLDLLDLE